MNKKESGYGDLNGVGEVKLGDMSPQVQLESHPIVRVVELATQEFYLKHVTIE